MRSTVHGTFCYRNLLISQLTIFVSVDPKILKGGAEDNVSAPSSFIANAHNELYAFYTRKGGFLKKKSEPIWAAVAPTESSIAFDRVIT